jgi:hypothetical protein
MTVFGLTLTLKARDVRSKRDLITGAIAISAIFVAFAAYFTVQQNFSADVPAEAQAPIVRWTGAGTDIGCGGSAGSGNWWSCAANWSTGSVPTPVDHVIFDSASSKNSTIDPGFAGTINSMTMFADYTGTVTQGRSLTVTAQFAQHGGTFTVANPTTTAFSASNNFFLADNQISDGKVLAIKADALGNTYVGGSFTAVNNLPIKYLAKWDGKSWSAVGGDLDGQVNALAIDINNIVYAGGEFTKAGAVTLNGIGKWNGISWTALDNGVFDGYGTDKKSSVVNSLAVDDQNNLYAGGTFVHAGSVEFTNHIARWNGTNWQKIGRGVGKNLYTDQGTWNSTTKYYKGEMVFHEGAYYVCKLMSATNKLPTDTSVWFRLTNTDGAVNSIIVKNNPVSGKDIYLGGAFNLACGDDYCTPSASKEADLLAKFDGSTNAFVDNFTLGGANFPDKTKSVRTIAFDDAGNLYAGGYKPIKISGDGKMLAKWDGVSWSGMGVLNEAVNAVTYFNGKLIIGGEFTSPKYFAVWGGSNWSQSYRQFDDVVEVLEPVGGNLAIGGDFTRICHLNVCTMYTLSSALAKWDGATVNPMTLRPVFDRYNGDGSAGNKFQVKDIYDLQAMTLYPEAHFKLTANIDATTANNWNGGVKFLSVSNNLKRFVGTLDGYNPATTQSFIISNLSLSSKNKNFGLFGVIGQYGAVSNLNIQNASLQATEFDENAGILAGRNFGILSKIEVAGQIAISGLAGHYGKSIGGIVGENNNVNYGTGDILVTSIADSKSNVSIAGSYLSEVGGLVGTQFRIPVKLTDISGYYTVRSTIFTTFSNNQTSGSINLANSAGFIGGLIGKQDDEHGALVNNSSSISISLTIDNPASIFAKTLDSIGGLAGYSFGKISNSSATGNIGINFLSDGADLNSIGGLVGFEESPDGSRQNIINSSATGNVTISKNGGTASGIGALVGNNQAGNISSSNSTGLLNLSGTTSYRFVGGLIGHSSQGNLDGLWSSGKVDINNQSASNMIETGGFGGLVGFLDNGSMTNSYSKSEMAVTADASCKVFGGVGGLVGTYSGGVSQRIAKSYALANVSSNCVKTGGLVGFFSGEASEVFSAGIVTGDKYSGGLAGYAAGTNSRFSDSFSFSNVSGTDYVGGITGFAKDSTFSKIYTVGQVNSSGKRGGFAGAVDARDTVFSNLYFLRQSGYNEIADLGAIFNDGEDGSNYLFDQDHAEVLASTKSAMKQAATYATFDLQNIWSLDPGFAFPALRFTADKAPVLSTSPATEVLSASARLHGNITDIKEQKAYARGFQYGLNTSAANSSVLEDGAVWNGAYTTGAYSLVASDLTGLTGYTFRAKAANIYGVSTGPWQVFTTDKATIPADINKDGKVDNSDFTILLFNWGPSPANTAADINKDGRVDDLDFTLLLFNWTG